MEWVVKATPRPLYPRESPDTHCKGGWVGPRAGLEGCGKSHPPGIPSPDSPALSESLHRLRYPAPYAYIYIYIYMCVCVCVCVCVQTQCNETLNIYSFFLRLFIRRHLV